MANVFGPVPSRRLGQSLGIDPIPLKICNWNCVYCQLGRTRPLVHERREFFPRADILAQVAETLASHAPGDIDWVTFVGSGETTLYEVLGWLIRQVKALTPLPVAVITNGSLLYLPEVRAELAGADAVLPSLDAGSAGLYRKINRPHPEASFARLVEGMAAFRQEYSGKLWVEVMLISGLNDSEPALREIAAVLKRICPDEVHLLLPTRPPVETWVRPADEEALLRAAAILGDVARVLHPAAGTFDLSGAESAADAVLQIITRHPMREEELVAALQAHGAEPVERTLAELLQSGRAQVVERCGVRFWIAAGAFFPAAVNAK